MTVSTEVNHEQYTGNGTTTVFPFRFRILKDSHMAVTVSDISGVLSTLILGTDYTIKGTGLVTGGEVILTNPLPNGWLISLDRNLPAVQETDLRNQGKFFAETHEDAFDYLTMLVQRALSVFGLALRKPSWVAQYYDALGNRIANLGDPRNASDAANKGYTDSIFGQTLRVPEQINSLPSVEQRKNKIPAFDDHGQPIVINPPSGSAADIFIEMAKKTGYSLLGEFESVNDLRGVFGPRNGGRVSVKSYYSGLGYGGGFFRWDANSTTEDDGGYTINPVGNSGPGRWKREGNSLYANRTVSIVEFGAKINDESFDSHSAIQNAIWYLNPYKSNEDRARVGGDVIFPNAAFYISDTILGSPNVSLRGTSKVGFSISSNGGTRLRPLPSMDPVKVMFDTAPYMQDGVTRYTETNEKIYGIEMQGYYGQQIDGIVFDGRGMTQACVRIMRCPTFKLRNCSFINTKVGVWINASWGGVIEDCHSKDTRYANILLWYANGVDIRGGYYGMYRTAVASVTEQWFHRPIAPENTPNIAYASSSIYAYNSLDIRISATFEGMNKLISAFYCRGINFFGGYIEDLNNPAEQNDHRVLVHSQASTINLRNMFINCSNMPFIFQSGNSGNALENGTITLDTPHMNTGFTDLIRGVGYGKSRAVIISNYPTTAELGITLQALRNQSIVFVGLLDDYLYRPSNATIGSGTFSISVSNVIAGGLYEVRIQSKSTSGSQYWDMTFDVYVGDSPDISAYVFRMRTGSQASIPKPTASFSGGVLTFNFTGTVNNSTVIKTVPKTEYNYSL